MLAIGVIALTLAGFARADTDIAAGGPLVHGTGFQMKTTVDESFCVETNVAVSATPQVYIARCTGRTNQRWSLTDGEDGASVVVGDLGLCLVTERDSREPTLEIEPCDYHSDQRFTVTPVGQVMRKHSDECLTVDDPIAIGSAIRVEECQSPNVKAQTWRLVP
jgi:hypothetical protein